MEKEKFRPSPAREYSELLNPMAPLKAGVAPSKRKLADVMKVELIEDKSPDEIRDNWLQYHVGKEIISVAIPVK